MHFSMAYFTLVIKNKTEMRAVCLLIKTKIKLKHQACSNWCTKYYWP